jgi:hypothetical protein
MKTWKSRVRGFYHSLAELEQCDKTYGIAMRCGYKSAEDLWVANPMIGGSIDPSDFGVCTRRELMTDSERIDLVSKLCDAVEKSPEQEVGNAHYLATLILAIMDKNPKTGFVDWMSRAYACGHIQLSKILEDNFHPESIIFHFIQYADDEDDAT